MIILISCLLVGVLADKYAVLVAGSAGYENYRHQSDVCHSYKTLIRNGYKAENIIVFAYDDIAFHKENPFKGTLWNRKSFDNQNDNVYDGCVIDYKKHDVSPQNFLYALSGFQELVPEGKRVLNTTSSDHIFIYFSDHGSVGLLVFPNDYLYEEEMTSTLQYMYENKKYEKLVYYLEACESGSMFLNLPATWNIYAVSAANERESSWATYCPPDDIYDGFAIGTCLGDEFSVNFLQDTDNQDSTETLDQQYQILREKTLGSHSLQWGDLTYTTDNIKEFLFGDQEGQVINKVIAPENVTRWDSRDVRLHYLQNKFQKSQQISDLIELQEEKKSRELFDEFFSHVSQSLKLSGNHHKSTNQKCLKQTIRDFENSCFKFSDYGLKYIKYFAEACDNHLLNQVQEAIALKCLIK